MRIILAAWLVFWFAAVPCTAAKNRSRERVRFTAIKFYDRKTPKYQDYSDPRATSTEYWKQIMVEYESEGGRDGWIDEVALEWHVLIQGRRMILLRKTVSYVDVPTGKHRAVVYIRPDFMKRYAKSGRSLRKQDFYVLVVARVNGMASDMVYYPERRRPRTRWWELKPPKVLLRPGELMNRLETPFAPLDYDYYEQIKLPSMTQ